MWLYGAEGCTHAGWPGRRRRAATAPPSNSTGRTRARAPRTPLASLQAPHTRSSISVYERHKVVNVPRLRVGRPVNVPEQEMRSCMIRSSSSGSVSRSSSLSWSPSSPSSSAPPAGMREGKPVSRGISPIGDWPISCPKMRTPCADWSPRGSSEWQCAFERHDTRSGVGVGRGGPARSPGQSVASAGRRGERPRIAG